MMKRLIVIFPIILYTACADSNSQSEKIDSMQAIVMNQDSIRENLNKKNGYIKTKIVTNSVLDTTKSHPKPRKNLNKNNSILLEYHWSPDPIYPRALYIEIFDSNKIHLNKIYEIPNELFQIKAISYGAFSNFESYHNITGEINFNVLSKEYSKAKLFLTGGLKEMKNVLKEIIIDEEISILQEFSSDKKMLEKQFEQNP